ncbi:hypothetical protein BDQ12DRAFT_671283 [Crucibulum laeve]|uniref:Uncharacterized protein n=1 Tax=Crucibulum laeve TaxID=68775 RepID=A0A5C3LHR6_9AGAR|nr:hypothetical protein BDQ12DRAFT_671283 [Crucibulum laeve]
MIKNMTTTAEHNGRGARRLPGLPQHIGIYKGHAQHDHSTGDVGICDWISTLSRGSFGLYINTNKVLVKIVNALGPMHGTHYTNILSTIIESAMLMLIFMTLMVATAFGVSPLYEIMATEALIQVQAIAVLWIVFQVTQGKAWGGNTSDKIT